MRTKLVALVVAAAFGIGPAASSVGADSPPLPNSIAAIGDSITQATNVCCWYGDHPGKSWSTGRAADLVISHYEQILADNPGIAGNVHNQSVAGAKMADAPAQAAIVVSQRAKYVTFLMGANDVCTSSPETMTSVDEFRSQSQAAMDTLASGLPAESHIFVASIPNVYRLWKVLHDDPVAQAVWWVAQICQSMLSPFNTKQDRLNVLNREKDFNGVLAEVCGQYANCLFDAGAVFDYRFSAGNVSKLDYFHPSVTGQASLAEITWAASWWPSRR
jgi:lysophospholipase L1-like esterase